MSSSLALKYSHNVIEHLGIKLYQNKPTNVIAELVSNSWDAYAQNVWINNETVRVDEKKFISFADDGWGMSYDELKFKYLVIGKEKREDKNSQYIEIPYKDFINKNMTKRYPMGRKGIGKLAPFGISYFIDLITVCKRDIKGKEDHRITWLQLNIAELMKSDGHESGEYEPDIILENELFSIKTVNTGIDEYLTRYPSHGYKRKEILDFLKNIDNSTGTLIILNDLTLKKTISKDQLCKSMGRRFTVTLLRDDFSVFVDKTKVDKNNALPKFDFSIPENTDNPLIDKINNKEVKYWVGFVKSADWPQDEAGVGVYAHGKIAQDRPFTFGNKGREIYTRYMYAVVDADWLDEFEKDVISTDRTNINWEDNDVIIAFKEWGSKKVSEWTTAYRKWREEDDKKENKKKVKEVVKKEKLIITETEQNEISDLISKVTPAVDKKPEVKEKLISTVAKAWTHKPMRKVVKSIWDSISSNPNSASKDFINIIENLNNYLIPESLSLAVTFSQRTYALSLLYELVHNGKEVDMQKLIARFSWILEPSMELLTEDVSLKRVIDEAEKKGEMHRRPIHKVNRGSSDKEEPDFVFLTNLVSTKQKIVVIEIKNPKKPLIRENQVQLSDYLIYIEDRYPDADISGLLIGQNANKLNTKITNLKILSWTEILMKSREEHLSLLVSMIRQANASDSRVADIRLFGGDETWQLLKKMSENDEQLKSIMEEFEEISESVGSPQ